NKIKNIGGFIGYSSLNKPSYMKLNNDFIEYVKDFNIPIIPIHQLKYLNPEDSIIYEALKEIGGNPDKIGEFDDFSFNEQPDINKVLEDFINSIDLNLYQEKILLPKYPNTKGKDSYEYLVALCHKGLEKRGLYFKKYLDRLNYELSIIHKMGYDDYFLIVWDFILYAKKNKILVGPGRGSAAGSLVSYCLGITEIDPLKYGLLFERFLNPERVTMPDIDTDFPDKDRDLVINHVKELYGELHVCNITAFGTFKIKSSVRELSRIFHIEQSRIDKIIDMIEKFGYEKLLTEYKDDELYNFLYVARGLENLPKHISTHAAGIILSNDSLDNIVPLGEGINGLLQSEFEASDLEAIGLLKMDFLGISNLTMISGMIKDIPGFSIEKLRNIPLDDPKVYKMLRDGDTLGIFQMEKAGFRKALRELKPTTFNDVIAILALYRPGPMDNIPTYIERKEGKSFTYLHKDLEPILKETYGVIVYQEQIMQIAKVFAGYSLGEADLLRRAVSKKDASKLDSMREDFILRSVRLGYSRDIANQIYDLIYKFANYGFNKSHSVAYAMFAYQMAYLKANYFNAFMPNIMNNVISNTETLIDYIQYAKQRGLITEKPNINISTNRFVYKKNWVFMPLTSIFSIGESVVLPIVEERDKNGLFKSFDDFINRCNPSQSVIEALVYSGALDIFGKSKKSMLENSSKQDAIFLKHIKEAIIDESEYDFNHLRDMEKKYIGLNLDYNLFKNAKPLYDKYRAISLDKLSFNQKQYVIFSFSDMKEIKTKKGDLM
ncbi:MAG: DNA polymerase III subunit alpha, partial [Acholeplasmatales bacterium]|nr:DNA polymerase III subunit alpha [Acholeplasmatales bacterium]